MKKSKIFLYFCLCFIIGIALRSLFSFDLFYAFIFLLFCLVLSIIFWPSNFRVVPRSNPRSSAIKTFLFKKNLGNKTYLFKKNSIIFLLGAFFLFLGILRFDISIPKIDENHIKYYNNSIIEFTGQITAEPDIREKHIKLTVSRLTRLRQGYGGQAPNTFSNEKEKIKGKILVNTYKHTDFNYGDWVKIKCKLDEPGIIESDDGGRDFDYGRYLGVRGIYSTCYRPDVVEKIDSVETRLIASLHQRVYTNIIYAKQKFKNIIDENLPLPQSGLLNAMLLGYRREMPAELTAQFSQTGLSHIVAISGLHISILAAILFYLFILLGLPQRKSFWPALIILFLYVIMIGFRASAIRSFIMAALLLYALKIGRLSKSINALILAGAVLLIINPKLLLWDVGFQLSFLAVLGILYFYPLFNKWLEFISDKYKIRSIISVTLSAQILTLPLVVYYFRIISIVSPLTNLLVLPILPIVMTTGIILIILGLIWSKLAFVFGFLVWIILSYILKVVELLSQLPHINL